MNNGLWLSYRLFQLGDEKEYNQEHAGSHSWTTLLDGSLALNPGTEMGHDFICHCKFSLFSLCPVSCS